MSILTGTINLNGSDVPVEFTITPAKTVMTTAAPVVTASAPVATPTANEFAIATLLPTVDPLPSPCFTAAYPLNQPANTLPTETRSLNSGNPFVPAPIVATFQQTFGANHINFDTSMAWNVVDGSKHPEIFQAVPITSGWQAADSAPHVPVLGTAIEGGGNVGGDDHDITYDSSTGIIHELFGTSVVGGAYSAQYYSAWDTSKSTILAPGTNSADAGGYCVLHGVLRYVELLSGAINHALRMTINLSRANANGGIFCPGAGASHASGQNWSSMAYMGMRLYLRADYTPPAGLLAAYMPLVKCLQTYGLYIADNGNSGEVTGDNDPRWNTDQLALLGGSITLADFTIVNSGALIDSSGAEAV